IEPESGVVLVMESEAPAEGAAAAGTTTRRRRKRRDFSTATSLDLLDRGHRHVRWYPSQCKAYRVSHGNGLLNLWRRRAKPHCHRGHEPGDIPVREDEHAELREDRAHDALDDPLALDPGQGRGARDGQLALEP